jgi:hypothetical protein
MQDFAPFIPELLGALSGPQTPEQARHICPHQFACYFSIFSCYLGYILIKKIGDNRRVLYDQVSIINYRCNNLRKIKSFREAGYDIVYLDETWINQNHCTDCM